MSNLSGYGDNKTYRGSALPREPYYYIRANLDLSNVMFDDREEHVFYFNKENSYAYLDRSKQSYPNPDQYPGFHLIDDNNLIGEVAVYTNPDLEADENLGQLSFFVGGLYRPSSESTSMDVWGGPTGNSPGALSAEQLSNGQSCYYGAEPLDPAYSSDDGMRRYLGLKITGTSDGQVLLKGNLFVVVKVYPKFQ
jgi:hypothetical protein